MVRVSAATFRHDLAGSIEDWKYSILVRYGERTSLEHRRRDLVVSGRDVDAYLWSWHEARLERVAY